jgi:hypothetical protein
MSDFKYIRARERVYERLEGTNRFKLLQEHKSISAAKHWTNAMEKKAKGSVRRLETLEKTLGPKVVKEMLNEQ